MATERPRIEPAPHNWVCRECGSAKIEVLDWILVNADFIVGCNENAGDDDYWCPICEVHEQPIQAGDYCEANGHTGRPCRVCGEAI